MKLKLLLLLGVMVTCFTSYGQYTPLPQLDENQYLSFVAELRLQADIQKLPELIEIADNMNYDEARRFMANPQVFADQLKNKVQKAGDPVLDAVRLGIIVSVLLNHFTNLPGSVKSSPRIGFALGMYAMFSLGTIYFLTEFIYTYRSAAEKISNSAYTQILNLSFITLFTSFVYAIQLEKMKLLIGLGPLLSVGIGGKQVYKDDSNSTEEKVKWGEDGLKRMQAGISLLCGFMLPRDMMIYLSYSLYFSKLFDANTDIRMNMFRLVWAISLR